MSSSCDGTCLATVATAESCIGKKPDEVFELVDLICPNQTETEILTGMECKTQEQAVKAAAKLQAKGCKNVLISMGAQGALLCGPEGTTPIACPEIAKENVIDTTGAGDALIGSLAHIVTKSPELPLEKAVQAACALATITVQAQGAQASYPPHGDPRVREILGPLGL